MVRAAAPGGLACSEKTITRHPHLGISAVNPRCCSGAPVGACRNSLPSPRDLRPGLHSAGSTDLFELHSSNVISNRRLSRSSSLSPPCRAASVGAETNLMARETRELRQTRTPQQALTDSPKVPRRLRWVTGVPESLPGVVRLACGIRFARPLSSRRRGEERTPRTADSRLGPYNRWKGGERRGFLMGCPSLKLSPLLPRREKEKASSNRPGVGPIRAGLPSLKCPSLRERGRDYHLASSRKDAKREAS